MAWMGSVVPSQLQNAAASEEYEDVAAPKPRSRAGERRHVTGVRGAIEMSETTGKCGEFSPIVYVLCGVSGLDILLFSLCNVEADVSGRRAEVLGGGGVLGGESIPEPSPPAWGGSAPPSSLVVEASKSHKSWSKRSRSRGTESLKSVMN